MKTKLFILVAVCGLLFTACSNNKEKAEKLVEKVLSQDGNASQKEYAQALNILNETFVAQNTLVDEAFQAVNNGDNAKANELLNQIREDENASQNSQLLSILQTADLNDANKAALEEYQKNMQSLSDKIAELSVAMLDFDD